MLRCAPRAVRSARAPQLLLRAAPRRAQADASPRPRGPEMPPRSAEGKSSMRSVLVLETLLDSQRKKRGSLQAKDATPLPLEDKASALPAKDPAQLAWERVDAELVRLLDQLRAEARREREAEEERVRIRQAAEKGVRLEAKLQPKFHLTRVGPRPGLSDLPAVTIPIAHRKRLAPPPPPPSPPPVSQPAAAASAGAQRAVAAATAAAPSAWDSAETDAADGAGHGGASRVRQLLGVIRSDVALLFTYVTAAKLRRMIAIESAHLTWIRFLLALLALLLFVPSDTPVSPQADTQRMLRLILLALLLMHTQQLLLNFASLSSYRRTMQASSVASAASFALLWLMAALLLPYSSPRSPASASSVTRTTTETSTTVGTATSGSTASDSPPSDTRAASAS